MKYVFILITSILILSCDNQKVEQESNSVKNNSNQEKSNTVSTTDLSEDYYIFSDGGKWKKADWLTDDVIDIFAKISTASRNDVINILDCAMSELAIKYPLSKVKPLLLSGHSNGTDFSVELFNEIGMMDNLNSCSKIYTGQSFQDGIKEINGTSNEFIDYSTGGKDVWISQVKFELQKSPEYDEFEEMVDVDKYCGCIVDDFWASNYFKNEDYSSYWTSTQYDKAVESCLNKSLK